MFDLTSAILSRRRQGPRAFGSHPLASWPVLPPLRQRQSRTHHQAAGKSTRPGVYKCNECRAPFSVTVGTVFERSKIGRHKWVLASHLYASSKKGMSAHQLHRMLGVTYKTAWFHRIREAMAEDVKSSGPLGGEGKTLEADETYIARVDRD